MGLEFPFFNFRHSRHSSTIKKGGLKMAKTTIKWLSHAGFQITSGGGKIIYIDP